MSQQKLSRRVFLGTTALWVVRGALSLLAGALPSVAFGHGGAQIKVGLAADLPSLDPHTLDSELADLVIWNVYEGLFTRAPAGDVIPWLAEAFEQTTPTVATLTLKAGIKFHDGAQFDAEAAIFSINRFTDVQSNRNPAGPAGPIKRARSVDNLTIEIELARPDPLLRSRLCLIAMMSPTWTAESGSDVSDTANGTGPYKVEIWQKNATLACSAFEHYWNGEPAVGSVLFDIIPDGPKRLQAIKKRQIDLDPFLLPELLTEIGSYRAFPIQHFSFVTLTNRDGSPLSDPRIRQAMNLAIDKERLLSANYRGEGTPLRGQICAPETYGFNPNLAPFPYDVEAARTLVLQSGLGSLEVTLQSGGLEPRTEEMVRDMLETVGFKVAGLEQPEDANIASRLDADGCFTTYHDRLFDADPIIGRYYCDEYAPEALYCNATKDGMLEVSRTEMDGRKRLGILQEIFSLGREDPVAIFLVQHHSLWASVPRLQFDMRADGRLLVNTFSVV